MKMPKSKKSSPEHLDIDAAMDGKEVVHEQEETKKVKTAEKSLSPFDFVKDIRQNKTGSLMDREQDEKSWSGFMVLRALSMKDDDVDVVNLINQYQNLIPPKAIYYVLCNLIESDKSFHPYIKTSGESFHAFVEDVARYYEISKKQAQVFIDVMGDEWAREINSLYECGLVSRRRK